MEYHLFGQTNPKYIFFKYTGMNEAMFTRNLAYNSIKNK